MDKNPFDIPLPSSSGGDYETYKRLAYFSFPKTLEGIEGIKTSSSPPDFRLRADTVIFDTQIKEANRYLIEYAIHRIKWYYFGDNVKIIGGNSGNRYGDIKCFFLPSSLETINNNAFASYENTTCTSWRAHEDYSVFNNIKNFSSLKNIGHLAMWVKNEESYPDTLYFPKIETYNINAFRYKKGMHIFLGENLKDIESSYYTQKNRVVVPLEEVYFHLKSAIPPNFGTDEAKKLTIYVPKGTAEVYRNHIVWKYAKIIEEVAPLEKITLNREEVLLDIGETFNLVATPIPENADDATIVWSTDNEDVISLDEGHITALASGTAHVYAKSTDGSIVAMCTVIVKTHAESVVINPAEITLSKLGQIRQLEATVYPEEAYDKSVKWSSSNSSVCTVTQNGMIVAVDYGTAIILAVTNDGGHIASCVVVVDASTGIADVAADSYIVKNVNGVLLHGTKGDAICVINSQGVVVYRGVCSGGEEQVTLPKGLYIVTIGDKTMKIVL